MRFQTVHTRTEIPGESHVTTLHTGTALRTGRRCGAPAHACPLVGKPVQTLSDWWCGRAGRAYPLSSTANEVPPR